jgi:murein DD-endopeptidase MepM/ murein hydrolase activator NlpD
MKKRFTFIVIPPTDGAVQEYRLSLRLLWGVGLCLVVLLGNLGYYMVGYYNRVEQYEILSHLRSENDALSRSIRNTRKDVAELEGVMAFLVDEDEKMRYLHQMEPLARAIGVGGPEEPIDELTGDLRAVPQRKRLALENLRVTIESMRRQIDRQKHSFVEIEQAFYDSAANRRHVPTVAPVAHNKAWISSRFGTRKDPFTGRSSSHMGVDFAGRKGTPIIATADGKVRYATVHPRLGKVVVIEHNVEFSDENGKIYSKEGIYQTEYGHLDKMLVKQGQRVKRGDKIAEMGSTGRSTGPHLHYSVRYQDRNLHRNNKGYVDPMKFILDRPTGGERIAAWLQRSEDETASE